MVTPIDTNLLLGIYNTRAGVGGVSLAGGSSSSKRVAPTAPWTQETTAAEASAAVKGVLAGRKFINESAAQLDLPGASQDYRKLFALYQGLSVLNGLVEQIQKKGLSSAEKSRIQSTFAKGLNEVMAYSKAADLDKVRLTSGEVATSAKTPGPRRAPAGGWGGCWPSGGRRAGPGGGGGGGGPPPPPRPPARGRPKRPNS